MELSQEFLIDMAINAFGYIIVGILAVIMVSLYKKKKTTDKDTNKDKEVINELCLTQADIRTEDEELPLQSNLDKRYEFISLNSEPEQKKRIQKKEPKQLSQEINSSKMNRKEAINIAKKMLVAGATHEKIKRVLPVSESELALLSINIK